MVKGIGYETASRGLAFGWVQKLSDRNSGRLADTHRQIRARPTLTAQNAGNGGRLHTQFMGEMRGLLTDRREMNCEAAHVPNCAR